MRIHQGALLLAITVFFLACAATGGNNLTDPEYNEGMQMGKQYAQKDVIGINCYRYRAPRRPVAANWARKHNPTLEEQGRSEMFKQGFYFGYQREFPHAFSLQCE